MLPLPSEELQRKLLDLYQQRVDPIFKVTHWLTVAATIKKQYKRRQYKPSSRSVQALEFAVYFLAMCSISDNESRSILLVDRKPMLRQYLHAAETMLKKADLLQKPDLQSLQAFLIYLVSCLDEFPGLHHTAQG